MSVKVSIIMPSYNVAAYIGEAIESALEQTLHDVEILCIDAESSDGTADIIKRYAAQDTRIHFIHSEKKSYGYQLNLGIKLAQGKYFGILETDDIASVNMYERLYDEAEAGDCDFVKADYLAFVTQDDGEKFIIKRKNFTDDGLYDKVLEPKKNFEAATGDWYNCQGIYRLDFVRSNELTFSETPGAAFQDIGFLYQAITKAKRAKYIKDCLYRYRIDRLDSSSNDGKGLRYSYHEYSRLKSLFPNVSGEEARVLYGRMARSFLSCYENLIADRLTLSEDERTKYYSWFASEMALACNKHIIKQEDFNGGVWERLQLLTKSEADYLLEKNRTDAELRQRVIPGNVSVIFGVGYYGIALYKKIRTWGYRVQYFADNNSALWGESFDQVPILKPNRLPELGANIQIFIANAAHHDDIRKQLLDMGISKEKIEVFV